MINRHSIFFNITLVLIISVISLTILYFALLKTDIVIFQDNIRKRAHWVLGLNRHINLLQIDDEIKSILKDANFNVITEVSEKRSLIQNGEIIFQREIGPRFPFRGQRNKRKSSHFQKDKKHQHPGKNKDFSQNKNNRDHLYNRDYIRSGKSNKLYRQKKRNKYPRPIDFKIIHYNNAYFVYTRFSNIQSLVLEYVPSETPNSIFYSFSILGVTVILMLAYITILKSIYPIKKLQEKVRQFGEGDLNIQCNTSKKDEISKLANEFHKAIEKIKSLTESRTLFLRNLMHEFHTPITKGKISVELLDGSQDKKILYNVFQRLELLMEELTHIEKLTSHSYDLKFKECRIIDIIDQAMDRLFFNENQVQMEINNDNLKVDFELFSIAVKNLMDNGVKYSNDQRVDIVYEKQSLKFISHGDPLKYPLERYLTPFFKGDDAKPGLGLGLYIVHNILKVHQYQLTYHYENANNVFSIAPND